MPVLIVSDLHLTDNPSEEYRFGLFPWLAEQAKGKASEVLILGDLTNAKNRHDAKLIHRILGALRTLLDAECKIVILKGNHDFIDPEYPFFGFLSEIPGVHFISQPSPVSLSIGRSVFVPSSKAFEADLAVTLPRRGEWPYLFCHQTFNGAQAENGTFLPGISPTVFGPYKGKVYSGDIHVPQNLNRQITYIGAPYRIRFGDEFEPRVLLINDDGSTKNLHFPCLSKHVITLRRLSDLDSPRAKAIRPGDQVKVRVELLRGEFPEWPKMRTAIGEIATARGWDLFGPELRSRQEADAKPTAIKPAKTAKDLIRERAQRDGLGDDVLSAGLQLYGG